MNRAFRWTFLFSVALCSSVLFAQTGLTVDQRLNALDAAAKTAQLSGDNAWMLTSAALVLMMTGPGLALFYGGLVRKKNVLGTMMQSFILMAVVSVVWALYGYTLAFSEGTPFVGGFKYRPTTSWIFASASGSVVNLNVEI